MIAIDSLLKSEWGSLSGEYNKYFIKELITNYNSKSFYLINKTNDCLIFKNSNNQTVNYYINTPFPNISESIIHYLTDFDILIIDRFMPEKKYITIFN